MAKRIFISYRRSDTQMAAGRLHDSLVGRFGGPSVFRDKEAIRPGYDWIDEIQNALAGDVVVVALLGPQWADSRDAEGRRRLDDPEDSNRVELETALTKRVPVIPVLVEGANVPDADMLPSSLRALTRRNAVRLRDDDWDADFGRLADALGSLGVVASSRPQAGHSGSQDSSRKQMWIVGAGLAALALVAVVAANWPGRAAVAQRTESPAASQTVQPSRPVSDGARTNPAPVAPPEAPVVRRESIVNIAGTWRDVNYAGVIDQVTQEGRSLSLKRWGVLPNGIGFESTGTGTIDGTYISHRYSTRYQTGAVSSGSCTGTAAADGSRIEGTCIDSLLGTIPVITVRQ
jgi:TIR domain-containing protein